MLASAEALDFEQAALLRDRLRAVESLGQKQLVTAGSMANTDVIGYYQSEAKACFAVLHYVDGNLLDKDYEILQPSDEEEDAMGALVKQYYLARGAAPKVILLPKPMEDAALFEELLYQNLQKKVHIRTPQRGDNVRLVDLAQKNAREEAERVTTKAERAMGTLGLLQSMLGLEQPLHRLESYDISNIAGTDIVASMVVYAGARPLKRDYRRFKMKSVTAHPDDYASMEEVLTRRLQRYADGDEKFAPLPDVFLIDGGMTHAAVAEKVCAAFGLHIPIFGMVKDDRHRTRALTTAEGHEIDLHADPAVFALIGQIQEETHRFAITYHHESHTRSSVASALDGIPNIGEVRKRKLLARFKSVKAIREAELPALQSELGRAAGRAVYDHFHPKEETP